MVRKLLTVIGGEVVLFGVPYMISPEFLQENMPYIVAAGLLVLLIGIFWPSKDKRVGAVSDERKTLFDQRVKVDGDGNTVSPTYNNNVQIGVQPEVRPDGELTRSMLEDGRFITVIPIRVTSPASSILLRAEGENLVEMIVSRPASYGVSTKGAGGRTRGENFIEECFADPSGKYEVIITTSSDDPPKLIHQLEP